MAGAPAAGTAPEGPTERLSWTRLGVVVLLAAAVIAVAAFGVRRAVAGDLPRADSWSVPYVDVTLSPAYQFQDPQSNPARDVALAFVVADPDEPCRPTWGTHYTLDEAAEELELDRRIAQLRSAGGDIMVSFGGQANDELAQVCTDPAALRAAYLEVVERYDVDVIDLDIEGDDIDDRGALARRAEAIAAVQQHRQADGEELDVWLTLPVAPDGLTAAGLDVVDANLQAGVDLLGVNVMTMNYGLDRQQATDLFATVARSLEGTADQVAALYERYGTKLDAAQRWAHVGATPMIGQNDVETEVFTLDDAERLADFAVEKGIGRVSTWSLNRDRPCGPQFADVVVHSNTCSGVAQEILSFAKVFTSLPGHPPTAPEAVVVPDQRTARDDPDNSPYPIWRPTAQYPQGYKVVWHGRVYQAKWYTQGADPSAPAASQWDTPWALIGPVSPDDVAPTLPTVPEGSLPTWDPNVLYDKGTEVAFDGLPYEARWSTKGDVPSTMFPVGPESPWEPLFTVPGEPGT